MNSQLEKSIAAEPIILPSSPFWEVFKTFGRDEFIALLINATATGIVARLYPNPLIISLTGPVVEKIGFFVAYFQDAFLVFKTTPKSERQKLSAYFATAMSRGSKSLAKDVAVHDPMYTILIFLGLSFYHQTPAWMLSVLSFIAAVAFVAVGEVFIKEIAYRWQIKKLEKIGFKLESYLESRFFITDTNQAKLLADFATVFHLQKTVKDVIYHDRYFETRLKSYNARSPVFRFRQRGRQNGTKMETIQIAYTRASQTARKKPQQFNFFPTRKDKLWKKLNPPMPWEINNISDEKLQRVCQKITIAKSHDVFFQRSVVRDPKTILVSVDQVEPENSPPFTVVEIKSHLDPKSVTLLFEAMRYLMLKYEVIQTTLTKSLLTSKHPATLSPSKNPKS